ncbi:MAG TPA: hypothetical protein VLQ20_01065 [Planococcus sp. (in: firmicutes)]|nr:hypothetical protein [Planococcus sp. (in: firmicutes)]
MAILIDLIQPAELIREIDLYIMAAPVEEIPHVFYVLSLASNRRVMLELLTDLAKGVDQSLPSSIVAGLLYERRGQYDSTELYRKAGMLASLLSDPEEDVAVEFKELASRNEAAQQAYGSRFKRKKTRERMLAKNETELHNGLARYAGFAGHFSLQEWGH